MALHSAALPPPEDLMWRIASAVASTAQRVMQQAPSEAARLPLLPRALAQYVDLRGLLPSGQPAYTTQRDVAQQFRDIGTALGQFPTQVPSTAGLFRELLQQAAGQPTETRRANLAQEAQAGSGAGVPASTITSILMLADSTPGIAIAMANQLPPEVRDAVLYVIRKREQQVSRRRELWSGLTAIFRERYSRDPAANEAIAEAKARQFLHDLGFLPEEQDYFIGIARQLAKIPLPPPPSPTQPRGPNPSAPYQRPPMGPGVPLGIPGWESVRK